MLRENNSDIAEFLQFDNGGQCHYDDGTGRKDHEMFTPSGWRELEYDVYAENGGLQTLIDHSPVDRSGDLKKNWYNMFYKPFSLWKREC